jgi:hypothetical protein
MISVAARTARTAAALLAASALAAPVLAAPSVPLIPRETLFGNPVKAAGRISPDGKWITWTAPVNGVMNIWVAPAAKPAQARPITAEKTRPIRQYFWAPDSKSVLYVQDKGGDENFLLYGVDPVRGKERSLTPFTKTRAMIIGGSTIYKDRLLIGLNNRDARWHDVHLLDLKTGKLSLVMKNDGYAGFVADNNLNLRLALKPNEAGGQDFYRIVAGKVEDKPFANTALADSLTTSPAGFTTDGKTMYWIDSRGRNTAALIAQDVATGTTRIVAQDNRADIGNVMADPKTGEIQAYAVDYLRNTWTTVDKRLQPSFDFLSKRLKGDWSVSSRTDDDSRWIVANDPVVAPSQT